MSPHRVRREAIKYGYRSGLEHAISLYLKKLKHKYDYESIKIEWEDLTYRTYTPDFILNNGIIIETNMIDIGPPIIIPIVPVKNMINAFEPSFLISGKSILTVSKTRLAGSKYLESKKYNI